MEHHSKAVPLPPPKKILQLEIGCYERIVKEFERKGIKGADLALTRVEALSRKEQLRLGTGNPTYDIPVEVSKSEKQVLLKIFTTLRGYSWSNTFGWIGQDRTLMKPEIKVFEGESSLYSGISTTHTGMTGSHRGPGLVTGLQFPGFGCEGSLPLQLCDLEFVSTIDFKLNLLQGSLPMRLGDLERLETLILSGNNLSGSLDRKMFIKFSKLRILDLSFNDFSGELPDVFANLTDLEALNMSGNSIEGNLPDSMSSLTQLKSLKLFSNRLTGDIPASFSALQALEDVNMSRNSLTNGLKSFLQCTNLKTLILSHNLLQDELTHHGTFFEHSSLLETLYINNNRLVGTFPIALCSSSNLKRLNLSCNNLHGVLPAEIGCMTQLASLVLTDNAFIGPLPVSLSNLVHLKDFHIFKQFPSECMALARGFKRQTFERVHVRGPSLGLNNVCWKEQDEKLTVSDSNPA